MIKPTFSSIIGIKYSILQGYSSHLEIIALNQKNEGERHVGRRQNVKLAVQLSTNRAQFIESVLNLYSKWNLLIKRRNDGTI